MMAGLRSFFSFLFVSSTAAAAAVAAIHQGYDEEDNYICILYATWRQTTRLHFNERACAHSASIYAAVYQSYGAGCENRFLVRIRGHLYRHVTKEAA